MQETKSLDTIIDFNGCSVWQQDHLVLSDVTFKIDKGEFEYETIYEIPAGTTSSSVEGEGAGTIIMDAGIKVLFIYTSTFIENAYTLYVSVTTSEDQTVVEDPNPVGP